MRIMTSMPALFAIYSRRQLYLRFFAFLESFGQKFGWLFIRVFLFVRRGFHSLLLDLLLLLLLLRRIGSRIEGLVNGCRRRGGRE